MNAQHTPGPWNVVGDKRECKVIRADNGICTHVARLHETWICDEHGGDAFSNARLIAAAPDLLAALRAVMNTYGSRACPFGIGPYKDCECNYHAALYAGRSAIAKAEGKGS